MIHWKIARSTWAPHLPAPWSRPGAHTVLLNADQRRRLRTHGRWTPTVLMGSIVATVVFALWCSRQLRSGARPLVPLSAPDSALRSGALVIGRLGKVIFGTGSLVPPLRYRAGTGDLNPHRHA
ncbi:hypothetical protein [Streptomyces sp. MBT53]|uniref:hypothetical protein n=1 Tax=Streptomyces sp. MBT53 TaxID=1488384 RepID=UPI0019144328|nr:hypothetical protein [Streptomyces sp. MBT53]MBK6016946.1 hypothetical protein [Streptomyces sp. MBT53]